MKKQVFGMIAALFAFIVLLPVGVCAANTAYAILYEDGTLVFQNSNAPDGRTVKATYEVDLDAVYRDGFYPPWYDMGESVRVVSFKDKISPTATAYWFMDCRNLTQIENIQNLDTAEVTTMSWMFASCNKLTALDLSCFDTANVTRMYGTFWDCRELTELDLSNFDTAKVTSMHSMFRGCLKLKTLYVSDKFKASEYGRGDMFTYCVSLVGGNGTAYDESHTDADYARIDTPDAPGYFTYKDTPAPADSVYAILYEDGTMVFQNGNTPETGRIVKKTYEVDLTAVYNYESPAPWYGESESVRVVSFADKVSPTSTAFWFCGRYPNLEQINNIWNLNTANVTNMSYMFAGCSMLNILDVSHFDTTNVTDMSGMFNECNDLTKLDVSHFNTTNVTNMNGMFSNCWHLAELDVSHFDTANVTDMESMFYCCYSLTELDVSHFETVNVTNMSCMFQGCNMLNILDVSHLDTTNVTDMSGMFSQCSGLTVLDLSYFDTANVKDMGGMFFYCFQLKTIYVSDKFTTAPSPNMFYNCESLVGGNGTTYDESHTDKEYARIDTASAPGYFTYKAAPVTYAISDIKTNNGKLSVTLTNPDAVTVAVSCFDASGKFVSATLLDASANAGMVALALPANAKTARVTLFDSAWRPLCEPRPAQI